MLSLKPTQEVAASLKNKEMHMKGLVKNMNGSMRISIEYERVKNTIK